MVSFGKTGTGSLGTAPVESDDCRAATVKRWVAGGEEVGSSADRHPRAQKKENRRAESPAGTAALNVATAPVKKLQASLRRGYNREHDEYKRELREYEVDKNGCNRKTPRNRCGGPALGE